MPVSLSSMTTRRLRIGSRISMRKGPTVRSVGSFGARREAWKACCSPSMASEKPQSRISRFG
jgi:hypothetical protein